MIECTYSRPDCSLVATKLFLFVLIDRAKTETAVGEKLISTICDLQHGASSARKARLINFLNVTAFRCVNY